MLYIVRNRSSRSRINNIRYYDLSDYPHLSPCLCCIGFRALHLTMLSLLSAGLCLILPIIVPDGVCTMSRYRQRFHNPQAMLIESVLYHLVKEQLRIVL